MGAVRLREALLSTERAAGDRAYEGGHRRAGTFIPQGRPKAGTELATAAGAT
jgi:hypothetical protein